MDNRPRARSKKMMEDFINSPRSPEFIKCAQDELDTDKIKRLQADLDKPNKSYEHD